MSQLFEALTTDHRERLPGAISRVLPRENTGAEITAQAGNRTSFLWHQDISVYRHRQNSVAALPLNSNYNS
jgi:hypothetical protein